MRRTAMAVSHDVECRDVERLDTDLYSSPVPVDGNGESSGKCVGVDVASSHELDALRERPVRWTHRTDMYPFGSRKDEERSGGVEATPSCEYH
ncbi:hypothetical protein PI125_g26633 [Phytophthora idaei]|nr:hypothetical protein PI125_g26633 [Phytophthora idaei]